MMKKKKLSYHELELRLKQLEDLIQAFQKGNVGELPDLEKPYIVLLQSVVDEKERLANMNKYLLKHREKTFQAINSCIWILDKENHIIRSNNVNIKEFSCNHSEIINKYCFEIVHHQKGHVPECPFLQAKTSLQRESMEMFINNTWFEIIVDPILDENGQYDGCVHIISDINKRKQTEKKILTLKTRQQKEAEIIARVALSSFLIEGNFLELSREITALVSNTFNIERVGVWLFNDDLTQLVNIDQYCLSSDEHSSGYILTENEFRNEFETFKSSKFVVADDPLNDPLTAGYVEGYLKPNRITSVLNAVIRSGGRNLGVLCFEHVDKIYHWEEDEILFASQLADQISLALTNRDRKLAEAKTQEIRAIKDAIFETGIATAVINEEELIITANPSFLTNSGYQMEEILGTRWQNYFTPDSISQKLNYEKLYQNENKQFPLKYEMKLLRKDGEIRDVLVEISLIAETKQIVLSMLDITESRRKEEKIRESEETYRNLFQNAQVGLFRTRISDGKILESNDQLARMFGYENREEFIEEYFTSKIMSIRGHEKKCLKS